MNTVNMLTSKDELSPEDALHRLLAVERIRTRTNQSETCVWCGKPANGKLYPDPSHEISQLAGSDTWWRACSTSHSYSFANTWMKLYNETLRPWRSIESARARRETTVAINQWPFNVGAEQ